MTKANMNWVASYNRATKTNLYECYNKFSNAKANAMEWCKDKMKAMNGHDMKILSHNTFGFTVGWLVGDDKLYIETPKKSYEIDLNS